MGSNPIGRASTKQARICESVLAMVLSGFEPRAAGFEEKPKVSSAVAREANPVARAKKNGIVALCRSSLFPFSR